MKEASLDERVKEIDEIKDSAKMFSRCKYVTKEKV